MNAKNIYEVLTALGAGALVAGCNTAPNPNSSPEIAPVAEVFTVSPPAKAPIATPPPAITANNVDNTATPIVTTPPPAPAPTPTPPPAIEAAPAKTAAEIRTAAPTPILRGAAVATSTPIVIATAVQPAKPVPTTTATTTKTAKKGDTEMKCGQGACG